MDWTDEGITLGARAHGESSAIATVLTKAHGRHLGLVRGARSKTRAPALQPGSLVDVKWRGRLEEHLGTFTVEPRKIHAHSILSEPLELSALSSACALAEAVLPERETHLSVYEGLLIFLETLTDRAVWPAVLVKWEVGLLKDLGYGLELDACAVTGAVEELTHVSPRTGRAVSAEEAAPYAGKLFPLPGFLRDAPNVPGVKDVLDGFRITGHFIERRLLAPHDKPIPEARSRFLERLRRFHEAGGTLATD